MEAVKQGAATVGMKSKTHAVIVALKVSLATYLKKFYLIERFLSFYTCKLNLYDSTMVIVCFS